MTMDQPFPFVYYHLEPLENLPAIHSEASNVPNLSNHFSSKCFYLTSSFISSATIASSLQSCRTQLINVASLLYP